MSTPVLLIVTPYAAAANNGNVRTAERWAMLLGGAYRVIVSTPGEALPEADLLIALHARRSHAALRAWRDRNPARPAVLVLTGTDLYHDLPVHDPQAVASLDLADRLIVLQERGIAALPEAHRTRASAIYQSAPGLPAFPKSARRLRALFVGHLREEKDPFTFLRAAAAFRGRRDVEFAMIGGLRDPALRLPLDELLAAAPDVKMLGMLPHRATRERIRRAHVLVVPSRMEGGANVIVEAVTAHTAVLASDCDGNLGMLGAGYPGCFAVRDHLALANLVARCHTEPPFLRHLGQLCEARAALFTPESERRGLLDVVAPLLARAPAA